MTILDWYDTITDNDIKTKAINNYNTYGLGITDADSLIDAYINGFDWVRTNEGGEFWSAIVYG